MTNFNSNAEETFRKFINSIEAFTKNLSFNIFDNLI